MLDFIILVKTFKYINISFYNKLSKLIVYTLFLAFSSSSFNRAWLENIIKNAVILDMNNTVVLAESSNKIRVNTKQSTLAIVINGLVNKSIKEDFIILLISIENLLISKKIYGVISIRIKNIPINNELKIKLF